MSFIREQITQNTTEQYGILGHNFMSKEKCIYVQPVAS